MVQANELGIHSIGIDISAFNSLISNVKVGKVDFDDLKKEINEKEYSFKQEKKILQIFIKLQKKYNLKIKQDNSNSFLEKWYLEPVKQEINFIFEKLKQVNKPTTKKILAIILSRTIRSCRATTHADLATLKALVTQPYYCRKHGKICKPLFSILSWLERYSKDTIKRFIEFDCLKTNTFQYCLQGDAKNINLLESLEKQNSVFFKLVKNKKSKEFFLALLMWD